MGCLLPRSHNMAEIQEVEDVPVILLPCAVCGRTFRPEALSKHSTVCERQHTKKRKKFDSAKQRIQGTELAEFLGPPPLVNKPKPPSPKKVQSRWKEKHEALVKTIRAEQIKPLDHSQCPHCDRFFGPKAFDRHEAWCKEQHSKIHVQNQDVSKAKQRLHARTKYRAPSFKSQRSLTKEKYSPARPPVGLSSSSTFPSPTLEHHEPRLHRNTSSVSATEVGVSGSGYGLVGRKSPALTRQNSIPRAIKRTEEEPNKRLQDSVRKHEDTSLPSLTRTSRAGSVSSQGSDSKSGLYSNHSVGAGETGGMGSAATATPLHETKPTIKSSYSTNRKGKRDDESKRWKRKPDASEIYGNKSGVVPDFSVNSSIHGGEMSGKNIKGWSRVKARNSIPLLVATKAKKNKGKGKKPKVSPVKSSSSHKTITLSDRETDLDNLKVLNRLCKDKVNYEDTCPGLSPCFDVTSDFEPSTELNSISDQLDVIQENKNENNLVVDKDFDSNSEDLTYVIEKNENVLENITYFDESNLLLEDSSEGIDNNVKNPVVVKPLSWIIPLSQSEDSEQENNNIDGLNSIENINDGNVSEVIKLPEEINMFVVDENNFNTISDNVETTNEVIIKSSHRDNDKINSNIEKDVVNQHYFDVSSNSKPSSRKSNKIKIKKSSSSLTIKNSSSSDLVIPGKPGENCPKKIGSSVTSHDRFSLSENLPLISCNSTRSYRLDTLDEVQTTEPISSEHSKKFKKKKKLFKCDCHKIIETIQSNLTLLSECKSHCARGKKSCDEDTTSKFSKMKHCRRKNSNFYCKDKKDSGPLIASYSDSELCKLNEAFLEGDGKNHMKFSFLNVLKNKCYRDFASQTCPKNVDSRLSDSENGSVCTLKDEVMKFNNGFNFRSSKRDFVKGGTLKQVCQGLAMGDRLRDVRRLLNRSVEAQSNDSFDYVEEDCSTLNGSLTERNPQFEMDEINSCLQYPEVHNNEVILTSVKRLSNPRDNLNRRIALREWQVVQSGCSTAPNGNWHQFDEINQNWKISNGGERTCGLTQPSVIHLPPLGNSTPKRLNRRWSPSGGEQITGNNANAQDDGALSKFCHECGGRYPVAGAKFCCLCGVRRLAI